MKVCPGWIHRHIVQVVLGLWAVAMALVFRGVLRVLWIPQGIPTQFANSVVALLLHHSPELIQRSTAETMVYQGRLISPAIVLRYGLTRAHTGTEHGVSRGESLCAPSGIGDLIIPVDSQTLGMCVSLEIWWRRWEDGRGRGGGIRNLLNCFLIISDCSTNNERPKTWWRLSALREKIIVVRALHMRDGMALPAKDDIRRFSS